MRAASDVGRIKVGRETVSKCFKQNEVISYEKLKKKKHTMEAIRHRRQYPRYGTDIALQYLLVSSVD